MADPVSCSCHDAESESGRMLHARKQRNLFFISETWFKLHLLCCLIVGH